MTGPREVFGKPPEDRKREVFGSPELPHATPATEDDAGGADKNAALQGFGQGATFGFLPWLQARASQAIEGGRQIVDGEFGRGLGNVAQGVGNLAAMPGTPFSGMMALAPNTPDFNVERQQFNTRDKALKAANPGSYMGGNIAGSILNPATLATGGGGVAAQSLGQAVKQGAKLGMATGAVQGLGESASEGLNLPDSLKRIAMQTVGGIAGGGLGGGAAYGLGKAAGAVRNFAGNRALAFLGAAGNAAENRAMNLRGPAFKQALAEDAIDSGVMTRFSGPEKMASRLDDVLTQREDVLQSVLKNIDEAAPKGVDPLKFMGRVQDLADDAAKNGTDEAYQAALAGQVDRIAKVAQARGQSASMPLVDANQVLKRQLSAAKGRGMRSVSMDDQSKLAAMGDTYDVIRRGIEEEAEAMAGPAAREALIKANQSLGNSAQMAKLLAKRAQQEGSNRTIGLTDVIGAAGGMSGGVAGGAAGLMLNKLLRGAGGQALAVQGVKTGRFLQNALHTPAAGYVGSVLGAEASDPLEDLLFGPSVTPAAPPGTPKEEKDRIAGAHLTGKP